MRMPLVALEKVQQGWERRKGAMARLREEGKTDTEIARQFGVSKARIGQILGPRRGANGKPA